MPWTTLKNALLFNAVCSSLLGAALLLAPSAIAALMGTFDSLILMVLGAGLLLFAADVAFVATRQVISTKLARFITFADIGWVVATPVVMMAGAPWLSFWGQMLLLDVGTLVAFCAICQWRGIQRQVVVAS